MAKPKLTPRERLLFAALILVALGSVLPLEFAQSRGISRQIEAERVAKKSCAGVVAVNAGGLK
jgi:hypothetical protein